LFTNIATRRRRKVEAHHTKKRFRKNFPQLLEEELVGGICIILKGLSNINNLDTVPDRNELFERARARLTLPANAILCRVRVLQQIHMHAMRRALLFDRLSRDAYGNQVCFVFVRIFNFQKIFQMPEMDGLTK
jgi:hypothetical protein